MSSTPLLALVARCRALGRPRSQAPDGELLARFMQQRDAAAFEELLERYAPLVWGVCRRNAATESDAEDAFQATFLALVRQAIRLDYRQPLGGWLHTVAVRIARKTAARARKQAPQAALPEPTTSGDIADEIGSRELFRLVDEEIERLPIAMRQPLILCCLQGRTRDEAAEILGCSVTAVKSRLERGRDLLRRRMQWRGLEFPTAFLVLSLTGERIRAALWAKTMQTALHTPAPAVAALAEASIAAGMMSNAKLLLAALLLVSSAAGVLGALRMHKPQEKLESLPARPAASSKQVEAPRERKDRHGDPLPDGAIARLGTVRWRHGFFIRGLAYSPDGKMIAAVGGDPAITLWDAATSKQIHPFPNRGQAVAIAFSPDGKLLAAADATICQLWDVASGKELRTLKGQRGLTSVAFAPGGKALATTSYDGTVRIWETRTGKELRCLDCKQGHLYSAVYSPDGKLLATAGEDSSIRLWDAGAGTVRRQLDGHKKPIWSLVFSPDGKHLASSSADETIRLWNVATGRQVRVFEEKIGDHPSIAFSPDGAVLASGRRDGTICLWDMVGSKEKHRWQSGSFMAVEALAFSPDGKTLASGSWDGSIRLWDAATGREKNPSDDHRGSIAWLRFAPEGKALISMGSDRRLLSWDLVTNTPRQLFFVSGERFGGGVLSPSGDTLAANGWPDSHLRLWNVRTGKPGRALGKPQKRISWKNSAFSPDGLLVAVRGYDGSITIWDAAGGKEVRQFKGMGTGLAFSPDSKILAGGTGKFGMDERAVRLWDVNSGKEVRSFREIGPISELAFSPDGNVLAAGMVRDEHAGAVQLWDLATGKKLCCHTGHRKLVSGLAFSLDGKLLASGSGGIFGEDDNSVHVWEAATGRLIRRFEGHRSCIESVAFAPDGLSVASGASDSTILLWDITGRRENGRWRAKQLTPRRLDACWAILADEDAAKAYDAVWALVAAPEQAVPFLRKKIPPIARPDAKAIGRWIADLDSADFTARQKATDEMSKLGDAIAPALRGALQAKPSLEERRRVQQLLDQTRDWTPEKLRVHRALQALEHIGTQSAREVLQTLAEGAPEARRTEETKAALQRMARVPIPAKNP